MSQGLIKEILSGPNMMEAYKQLKQNKGGVGIDGITIDDIDDYIKANWKTIRERI